MNWDNGIEISGDGGNVLVTLGELHSLLTWELSKDDVEEFAGELIKFTELSELLSLVSE